MVGLAQVGANLQREAARPKGAGRGACPDGVEVLCVLGVVIFDVAVQDFAAPTAALTSVASYAGKVTQLTSSKFTSCRRRTEIRWLVSGSGSSLQDCSLATNAKLICEQSPLDTDTSQAPCLSSGSRKRLDGATVSGTCYSCPSTSYSFETVAS